MTDHTSEAEEKVYCKCAFFYYCFCCCFAWFSPRVFCYFFSFLFLFVNFGSCGEEKKIPRNNNRSRNAIGYHLFAIFPFSICPVRWLCPVRSVDVSHVGYVPPASFPRYPFCLFSPFYALSPLPGLPVRS